MVQRSKDCHNGVIISSLQGRIKSIIQNSTSVYVLHGPCMTCTINLSPSVINIDFSCFGPYLYFESLVTIESNDSVAS